MNPKALQISPLERKHALQVLTWRYGPPYEMYDLVGTSDDALSNLLRPDLNYFAILDDQGEMIAYRCFGTDAQVPGGDYTEEALDLGGGLRPDLTGKGFGMHILEAAMRFGMQKFKPALFRVTVAAFNVRARKVCERLRFVWTASFVRPKDGVSFNVLTTSVTASGLPILSEEKRNGFRFEVRQ